ncbi:unnamed protein product [Ixodes persulcatus]
MQNTAFDISNELVNQALSMHTCAPAATPVQDMPLDNVASGPARQHIIEAQGSLPNGQMLSSTSFAFGGSTTSTLTLMRRENAELRKKYSDLNRKYKDLQNLHEQAKSKLRSIRKKVESALQETSAFTTSTFLNKNQKKKLSPERPQKARSGLKRLFGRLCRSSMPVV